MDALKAQLKTLIIRSLMLEDLEPSDITDAGNLFGDDGIGLDSVDALELAIEIEREFNVRIPEDKASRTIFTSVDTLSTYISSQRADA